jgi:hypothetical protein
MPFYRIDVSIILDLSICGGPEAHSPRIPRDNCRLEALQQAWFVLAAAVCYCRCSLPLLWHALMSQIPSRGTRLESQVRHCIPQRLCQHLSLWQWQDNQFKSGTWLNDQGVTACAPCHVVLLRHPVQVTSLVCPFTPCTHWAPAFWLMAVFSRGGTEALSIRIKTQVLVLTSIWVPTPALPLQGKACVLSRYVLRKFFFLLSLFPHY